MRQTDFGAMVGVSQPAISALVDKAILTHGDPAGTWLLAYCARLREQAAGRLGASVNGLDLAQERAALAREQRIGHAIKNSVARGQYASVELLAQVLAEASQAVASRFDHLVPAVRRAVPELSPAVMDLVMATIATARNEWVRETAELVARRLVADDEPDDDSATTDSEGPTA
jgi:phage terminase Nu1 subunit (DNA packaging protein)